MPRATVLKTTQRFELTTLPADGEVEGGWVELRRLSFGEKLEKDAEAMKLRFDVNTKDTKDVNAEVAMVNVYATTLEFARCVMDHNLEDEKGVKLDLKKQEHVKLLDPRVGQEIQELIGKLNDFENAANEIERDAEGK